MTSALTQPEERILSEFSKKIREEFPEHIVEVYLYGSKARGDHNKDSDMDILVVSRNTDWRVSDSIRRVGYELDDDIDNRFSIQVIPENRIEYMKQNNLQFFKNFTADAMRI